MLAVTAFYDMPYSLVLLAFIPLWALVLARKPIAWSIVTTLCGLAAFFFMLLLFFLDTTVVLFLFFCISFGMLLADKPSGWSNYDDKKDIPGFFGTIFLTLAVLGIVAAVIMIVFTVEPVWVPYTSAAGGYSVKFPGPVESKNVHDEDDPPLATSDEDTDHMMGFWFSRVEGYSTTYQDIPVAITKLGNAESILKAVSIRDFFELPAEVLVSKSLIKYRGLPCLDVIVKHPGTFVRRRCILSKGRVYKVMVYMSTKEECLSGKTCRFLNSFRINSP